MKTSPQTPTRTALLVFCLVWISLSTACQKPPEPITLKQRFLLAPEKSYEFPRISFLEEGAGRKLSSLEKETLNQGKSGPWKTYSDEQVSFDVPDSPLIQVQSFTPEELQKIKLLGGAVGDRDRSYQRLYRITLNKDLPYAFILVSDKTWFDEGICLCGAVVVKSFAIVDGNLQELSFLEDGAVKVGQVLNDTHRAILSEWTHTAISQEAYVRIATSLRLKPCSPRSEKEWIAFSQKNRGPGTGFGWLYTGIPSSRIEQLLGKAKDSTPDELVYVNERQEEGGKGFRVTLRFPLKEGLLARLPDDWRSQEELPAPRGSRDWVIETVEKWKAAEKTPSSNFKPPADDLRLILDLLFEKAAKAEDQDWRDWSQVIKELAKLGIFERKALDLVVERFPNPNLSQVQGVEILELYKYPKLQELLRKRIKAMMLPSAKPLQRNFEFNNLLADLEQGNPLSDQLIEEAATHSSPTIRWTGADFIDRLPRNRARRLLANLLKDSDKDVREAALNSIQELCDPRDKAWLTEIAQNAPDEKFRRQLEGNIHDLDMPRYNSAGKIIKY